ncbi:MAG: hypothetical protein CME06_10810 [Gemmatimonadetes bacterium]|nr:hypothetical protein [Gemmatimonadota bacterium]
MGRRSRVRDRFRASRAIEWVEENQGAPFFLWLHVWDPHFRYVPPAPWDDAFAPPGGGSNFDLYERLSRRELSLGEVFFQSSLNAEGLPRAISLYDAEIRYTDQIVGEFLERLRALELIDSAMIVLASDHGESLGEHDLYFEHGEYLYEPTLRIPLLVHFPGGTGGGARVDELASITDIYPTVLGAVGLDRDLPGRNLDPRAREPPPPVLLAETGRNFYAEDPRRPVPGIAGNWLCAISGEWKLIRIPSDTGFDCELYDLSEDPSESHNLYSPHDTIARRLEAEIEQWIGSFSPSDGAMDESLDPATAARLRALGYLD